MDQERRGAGRGRWPGREPAAGLESRLPECQPLRASGPPGLLTFAHTAADRCASLRQRTRRARQAEVCGRWPGRGPVAGLKSRLSECQHLQASCLPGLLLPRSHGSGQVRACLRQEARRTPRAARHGRWPGRGLETDTFDILARIAWGETKLLF